MLRYAYVRLMINIAIVRLWWQGKIIVSGYSWKEGLLVREAQYKGPDDGH
jgi:hypothetical protein